MLLIRLINDFAVGKQGETGDGFFCCFGDLSVEGISGGEIASD